MKTFSGLTKEELYKNNNENPCCDNAELLGMLLFGALISDIEIKFVSESSDVLGRYTTICDNLGIKIDKLIKGNSSTRNFAIISDADTITNILEMFNLKDNSTGKILYRISSFVFDNECCCRAFSKGAFLGGGSVIDPYKNYNMEIVTSHESVCGEFANLLLRVGFGFKSVIRKKKYVLYTKNSEVIADFLTYIGAYKAQMELLNIKIEKEIRNDFNRSVNSETANLDKTIEASVKQIQAIEHIDKEIGIDNLPDELRDIARLRLKFRSASLTDLGKHLTPPLGKSGVNHRLKKIISIAEENSLAKEE